MKKILYLNNYMSYELVRLRNNMNIYSQPANNKILGIVEAMLENDCQVKILSSGLVNNKTGKIYRSFVERIFNVEVEYCPIIDFPLLNTISSIFFMYKYIKKEYKKNNVDNIVFYNFKPEVAWAAFIAKKILNIPITVEYEDGYSYVSGNSWFKTWMFNVTETVVKGQVDSAILVNSDLKDNYSVPNVIVRGIVNKDFYSECRNYRKVKNSKFTILYTGGLDKERGIDVLIGALKYIDFDCRVIICGKGKISCSDERVDFRGFIPHDEVKKLMMQSDVLVQCQHSCSDFAKASFPSKLFEYIATGNRIISSDIDEIRKFAGDSFEYYKNDDPQCLANVITRVYCLKDNSPCKVEHLCEDNLPKAVGMEIVKILE